MPMPKKPRPNCKQCGKEVSLPGSIFCSNKCQLRHQYEAYIQEWKAGRVSGGKANDLAVSGHIRRYLTERDGEKCSLCGWSKRHPNTDKVPLEIDHMNGDNTDHSESNLRLICPNCHSLTPTYRNLNRGNGRAIRRRQGNP